MSVNSGLCHVDTRGGSFGRWTTPVSISACRARSLLFAIVGGDQAEALCHRSTIAVTMRTLLLILLLIPVPMQAQTARGTNPLAADVERLSAELNAQVVAWRRDFHQHPELGNRETRTAKVIADELRKLGFAVATGVATTGVVGVLKGG